MYGTFLMKKRESYGHSADSNRSAFRLPTKRSISTLRHSSQFHITRSKGRSKFRGSACRSRTGPLFTTGVICDSSPDLSEVTRFYDILVFFKERFCGANRIRTCSANAPDLQSGPALQLWRVPINLPFHLKGRIAFLTTLSFQFQRMRSRHFPMQIVHRKFYQTIRQLNTPRYHAR